MYMCVCVIMCVYIYMYVYIHTHTHTHTLRFPTVSLEFFIDNPSRRTMALGSIQLLTEMSTRNISWGVKAAGA